MKNKILVSVLICAFILSSCGENTESTETIVNTAKVYEYENITLSNSENNIFSADENNILYIIDQNNISEKSIIVNTYNENGKSQNTFNVDFSAINDFPSGVNYPVCFEVNNNKLYFVFNLAVGNRIYEYNTENHVVKELLKTEDYSYIDKICFSGENIYILGTPNEEDIYVNEKISGENGDIYYEGDKKIIEALSMNSNVQKLDIMFPVAFTVKNDGTVLIYAFDKEKGYYFTDTNDNNKKYNNNFGIVNDIDFFGNDDYIVISSFSSDKLFIAKPDENSGKSDICDNVFSSLPNDIKCNSNYIFYKSGSTSIDGERKIFRLSAGSAFSKGKINIISSEYISDMPFSDGYEINLSELTSDMFSTKILSVSDSFDISYFTTDADYAENMRTSCSYYPLNDIPGVSEYIDKCYPYLKEASTNEKGDIWVLPIDVNIPVIVYNKENCEKAGFDFENNMNITDFADIIYNANEKGVRYDCIRFRFIQNTLSRYLLTHDSFDTDDFRNLASFLKDKCTEDVFKFDALIYSDLLTANITRNVGIQDEYTEQSYNEIFFTLLYTRHDETEYLLDDENLAAISLPSVSGETNNNAVCTFLCVNPKGENLENAINFISSLATKMSESEKFIWLTDNKSSQSDYSKNLREIYSSADVYFSVPSEIYYSDFDSFTKGEITLDEFIESADEKLKLYSWEKE